MLNIVTFDFLLAASMILAWGCQWKKKKQHKQTKTNKQQKKKPLKQRNLNSEVVVVRPLTLPEVVCEICYCSQGFSRKRACRKQACIVIFY